SATDAPALALTERTTRTTDSIAPMRMRGTTRGTIAPMHTLGTTRGIDFIGRTTVTQDTGRCIGIIDRLTLMERTFRGTDFIGWRASGSRTSTLRDRRLTA